MPSSVICPKTSPIFDLAQVLQTTLRRLITHLSKSENECHFHPGVPAVTFLDAPAYNFYIHYGEDWFIRIIPRLIHRAGFELGTGLSVNSVDPVDAAAILKAEQV
jgi:galactose-1-phosphate uridylyltransferase